MSKVRFDGKIRSLSRRNLLLPYQIGYSVNPKRYVRGVLAVESEKRHAGVGDGGVVLIGDAAVVAENLPFFRLDQSEQAIDGREAGDAALIAFFLNVLCEPFHLEFLDLF